MNNLLNEISGCLVCKGSLAHEPRPVLQASENSKIIIIGQAPGRKVHQSGIPWDDASGIELRRWLGVSNSEFYNPEFFALIPMGFCYPGKGKSGDLPPREECAPLWHDKLMSGMKEVKLIILIGKYAQKYYLRDRFCQSLTENVRNFKDYLPQYLPLVHPSPRNRIWQKKNPWFEEMVIPELRKIVTSL